MFSPPYAVLSPGVFVLLYVPPQGPSLRKSVSYSSLSLPSSFSIYFINFTILWSMSVFHNVEFCFDFCALLRQALSEAGCNSSAEGISFLHWVYRYLRCPSYLSGFLSFMLLYEVLSTAYTL